MVHVVSKGIKGGIMHGKIPRGIRKISEGVI
jgi:hypothetical protein